MRLLIRGALILTMKENDEPFSGDILIERDRIAAVVPRWEGRADEVIDASGMVAMPGLINAHNHTPMTLMRAFCDDLRLMDWLEKKMLPAGSADERGRHLLGRDAGDGGDDPLGNDRLCRHVHPHGHVARAVHRQRHARLPGPRAGLLEDDGGQADGGSAVPHREVDGSGGRTHHHDARPARPLHLPARSPRRSDRSGPGAAAFPSTSTWRKPRRKWSASGSGTDKPRPSTCTISGCSNTPMSCWPTPFI